MRGRMTVGEMGLLQTDAGVKQLQPIVKLSSLVGAVTPLPDILSNCVGGVQRAISRLDAICDYERGKALQETRKNYKGNHVTHELKKTSRKAQHKRRVRVLCTLGWFVCFPAFLCYNCVLRSAPVDSEDVRDDPCYTPCI